MADNATHNEDIVIVKVNGNCQLRPDELDQLDALFTIHGLAWHDNGQHKLIV